MISRRILEVTSYKELVSHLADSGFNTALIEDLPNGHSIIEIWCSDSIELPAKHQKNLGNITSFFSTLKEFIRWLPSHAKSLPKLGRIGMYNPSKTESDLIEEG